LRFFLETARTFGDVVTLPLGVRRLYLLAHPDHIRYVLQEDERHFLKSPAAERIRPLFGKSLTTVDGEDWRRRRHLMRPVFTPQRMAALVPIIVETTDAMLQRWRGRVATGLAFDVFDEMTELTRSIMLRVLFGVVSYEEAREVGRAVTIVAERVNRGLWSALGWLPRLRIARQERYERALSALDAFLSRRIEEGRGRPEHGNLLSALLSTRSADGGQGFDGAELRDEL